MANLTADLSWLHPFTPPTSVIEALERGLQWAEKEERWTTARLFRPIDRKESDTCDNVQACSIGIMLIVFDDGNALETESYEALKGHPIGEPAIKYLSRAFNKRRRNPAYEDALDDIIEGNDSFYPNIYPLSRSERHKLHHEKIVNTFRTALELARKEQGSA